MRSASTSGDASNSRQTRATTLPLRARIRSSSHRSIVSTVSTSSTVTRRLTESHLDSSRLSFSDARNSAGRAAADGVSMVALRISSSTSQPPTSALAARPRMYTALFSRRITAPLTPPAPTSMTTRVSPFRSAMRSRHSHAPIATASRTLMVTSLPAIPQAFSRATRPCCENHPGTTRAVGEPAPPRWPPTASTSALMATPTATVSPPGSTIDRSSRSSSTLTPWSCSKR